jgi:hypothetical protein
MLHFEVEKTNPWGICVFLGGEFFLKSQFLFFSDILEFQVGSSVNQQIKNMWPNLDSALAYTPVIAPRIFILRKSGLLGARSRFGGVSSADRKATNQGVSSNCIFQIGSNAHFYWLGYNYFCSTRGFPKNPTIPCSSRQVFLPLYIDTNHNDVGGDAHFMK